jgi:hypothetical protein
MNKILICFFLTICCSCITRKLETKSIPISIDSYGDENVLSGKNYYLLPDDSAVASNYLLFTELSFYINRILEGKGYKLTKNYDSANCIIFFKYGTFNPQTIEKESYLPVYGQTGVRSSTTIGSASIMYYPNSSVVNYQTNTNYNPTYGIVGQRTIKAHETYYSHYMILSAFDSKTLIQDFNKSLRWKIISKIVSKDSDLRRVFPYLVLGSTGLIGKDSHQNIVSEIKLDDTRIPWLLEGTAFDLKTNSIEKPIVLSSIESEINQLKSGTPKFEKYNSFNEIRTGDICAFKSFYGEIIYGVIENNSGKKIKIKTFPTAGLGVVENVHWKEILKIIKY